jgi:2-polyprenyl-3-methyl-5-hydroxy-6-metoxy-1,4-benzoquinol methylase
MGVKKWFEDWFDTEYYHLLYQHRDEREAERFLKAIVQYLGPSRGKALDVACGRGRHSVILKNLGFDTTGLDLSSRSIAEAKKRETNGLSFVCGDMCADIPKGEYDYIFNLFTSFGYFDDPSQDSKALHSMLAGLKPQGKLVLDYLNSKRAKQNIDPTAEQVVKQKDVSFICRKKREGNRIVKSIEVRSKGVIRNYEEKVRLYEWEDFMKMLEGRGNVLHSFGSYDLKPYDPEMSERLILVVEG